MGGTLVVGSRGSPLALAQTAEVIRQLEALHPDWRFIVKRIKTTGDIFSRHPLPQMGGKGVFVKEIEQALLSGEVHLAVHSFKDLPVLSPPGLGIAALCRRHDARDVLVSRQGLPLAQLPAGTLLGSSSPRRRAQLRALRPDLKLSDLRGNLGTRLRRVTEGAVEATVLAAAGLKRMGWEGYIAEYLSPEACLSAVGQGALAVQIREDDKETWGLVSPLDHLPTRRAVAAERTFLSHLGGGCHTPIAALGEVRNRRLRLQGMVASADGSRLLRDTMEGNAGAPEEIGALLAETLLSRGAREILADL